MRIPHRDLTGISCLLTTLTGGLLQGAAMDRRVIESTDRLGGAAVVVARAALTASLWWLTIVVAAHCVPAPAESAPKIGATATIQVAGLPSLPIPVERTAFDLAQRGFRESDEDAIDRAFTEFEWIAVSHGQTVRIVTLDGNAVEAEVLEGVHAGRRGWHLLRQLVF